MLSEYCKECERAATCMVHHYHNVTICSRHKPKEGVNEMHENCEDCEHRSNCGVVKMQERKEKTVKVAKVEDGIKMVYSDRPDKNGDVFNHSGVVTLATYRMGRIVVYGVAYCATSDKFEKNEGRSLAKARLATVNSASVHKHPFAGAIAVNGSASYKQIQAKILADIYSQGNMPFSFESYVGLWMMETVGRAHNTVLVDLGDTEV